MKLLNHYRRFLFLPTMLLAATFASAQIPNDSIVADFRYFIHQLEATHPDPYTKDDSVTTREELCWRIRAFLAPLRDGHTQIHYPETQGSFSLVPIRFKAVGDGLFVRRLPKGHQHLIGSRLIAIENIQTKDLCEDMMKIYPAENEIGKLANICGHGHQPVVLGRIIPNLRRHNYLSSDDSRRKYCPIAVTTHSCGAMEGMEQRADGAGQSFPDGKPDIYIHRQAEEHHVLPLDQHHGS